VSRRLRVERTQQLLRVQIRQAGRQHNVPSPALWDAKCGQIDHTVVNPVADPFEGLNGDVNDLFGVVLDGRHVFDDDDTRPEDFGSPGHLRVYWVPWIVSSGVIVKVGIALTWRPAN
jgi:hypothetical protein